MGPIKPIKLINLILEIAPQTVAIYTHGSVATKNARTDSDLDIGILLEHGTKAEMLPFFKRGQELEKAAGRPVDISFLSLANPVFAKQVISSGVRIYTKHQRLSEEFEMYAYSFYAKLNEERREILKKMTGYDDEDN